MRLFDTAALILKEGGDVSATVKNANNEDGVISHSECNRDAAFETNNTKAGIKIVPLVTSTGKLNQGIDITL